MNKHVIVIYGSPRPNGNSDKLGQAFVSGCKAAQNIVSEFYIRNMKINGCLGCEYCYSMVGECSQKDDMVLIYEQLFKAETIVFVSPIYYQNVPAQLKALIDRMYISENKTFSIKKAIVLATYATRGNQMSKLTKQYFATLIKYHGWKMRGSIFVSGMDERDDILEHESLKQASDLGRLI